MWMEFTRVLPWAAAASPLPRSGANALQPALGSSFAVAIEPPHARGGAGGEGKAASEA